MQDDLRTRTIIWFNFNEDINVYKTIIRSYTSAHGTVEIPTKTCNCIKIDREILYLYRRKLRSKSLYKKNVLLKNLNLET